MKNEEIKPELMKLLGITNEKVADKVIYYAKAVNDGPTNPLLHTTQRKKAIKSLDDLKANDYAVAKALNELTIKIINTVASAYQEKHIFESNIDTQNINKSYILLSYELNKIYIRNKQLDSIYPKPTWQNFDIIEGNEWEIKQYIEELLSMNMTNM